ncbi:MAG: phosphoserine transaminase [Actinomycetales bacterium]|nr:phosphoserine transaminase [Actinomycetales bacterium]
MRIPADLLPADGRFGSGPSRVRKAQVDALADVWQTYLGTSHRQKTVKSQVGRLRQGLADLFSLPEGYEVVLGNGGSTAFWDIASFGLIRDRAQFLSFGEFGSKFAKGAKNAPHLGAPTILTSDPGSAPVFEAEAGIDAYCSPHNETSTGVAISPTRVAGADADALMVFDATSGAGGLAVDPAQFDTYYFAPQKSFGSDGGLWFALMSPRAIERAAAIKESGRWIPDFLDLQTAIDNSRLDQTYNTPALATILLMAEQVDWFNGNGGLDWCVGRSAESSGLIYDWAEDNELATPFVTDPALRSKVVATIDIDEAVDATSITKALRLNGIVDTEPYRKLGRNQLRIAVFPAVEPEDVRQLLRSLDYVITQLT